MKRTAFEWIILVGGIGVFVLLTLWGLTEVLPGADRGY